MSATASGSRSGDGGAVPGVIARRVKDDEKVEWEQLYVDIGARDGEEARALVEPGDPMVVVGAPVELAGGRVASRSLDDRAGVYVALEALRRLDGANVAVVAAAQEELGARRSAGGRCTGSGRTSRSCSTSPTRPTWAPTARAPAATTSSAAARRSSAGPAMNPRVLELLLEAAREEGIEHTVEVGREDLLRRRRHLLLPGRDPDRARLDPAPQHALAERDRPARRPRGVHPAARRLRRGSWSPARATPGNLSA